MGEGNATPAVECVERYLKKWRFLYEKIEKIKKSDAPWSPWTEIMRSYVLGSDTFPEVFTGKLKAVDRPNLADMERWTHKDGKIVKVDY